MTSGQCANKLNDIHDALANLTEIDQRYRSALDAADQEQIFARSAACLVADGELDLAWVATPGAAGLSISSTAGAWTTVLDGVIIPSGAGLTGKVFELGAVEWVEDYCESDSITHEFDEHSASERLRGLVAVPIVSEAAVIGVLSAGVRHPRALTDRMIEQTVIAANSAHLAITAAERARHAVEGAVQEERRAMAIGLHDTVGALLYAIGAGLRGLDEPTMSASGSDRIGELTGQTAEASRLLRDALRTLHASPNQLALSAAVQEECNQLQQRSHLRVHMLTLGELPELDPAPRLVLVRAVREALHNVEKHAQAHSVSVTISATATQLSIAVIDDGIGIEDGTAEPGIGLASTVGSLAAHGGILDTDTDTDGGTRWRVRLPL